MGLPMAQAVIRQLLTRRSVHAESALDKVAMGQDFLQVLQLSSVSVIPLANATQYWQLTV